MKKAVFFLVFLLLLFFWFQGWEPLWTLVHSPAFSWKSKIRVSGLAAFFILFAIASLLNFFQKKWSQTGKRVFVPLFLIFLVPLIEVFWVYRWYKLELCVFLFTVTLWICSGMFFLRKLFPTVVFSVIEKILVSLSFGLIAHVHMIYYLGILHLLQPAYILATFIPFGIGTVIWTWQNQRFFLQTMWKRVEVPKIQLSFLTILLLCFSFVLFFLIFQATLLPESRTDALSTHLNVPKTYLEQGGFVTTPETEDSTLMPISASLIFLIGLLFHSAILSKLFVFLTSTGIFFTFFLFSSKKIFLKEFSQSLMAAAFFSSTHVVTWTSSTAYADIPGTFFYFLGIFYFCLFWEKRNSSYAYLTAFFFASSMLFRYQAWFFVTVLLACSLPLFIAKKFIRLWLTAALGVEIALIILLPFFIKNLTLGHKLIAFGINAPLQKIQSAAVYLGTQKDWKSLTTAPVKISITSYGNAFGGIVGIGYLLFFPILVCKQYEKKSRSILQMVLLLTHCIVFLFWLKGGIQDVRYLIPFFAVISVLIFANLPKQRLFVYSSLFVIFLNFPYFPNHYPYSLTPFPYPSIFWARGNEEGFKTATVPSYGTFKMINSLLSKRQDAKILLLNESHLFYLDPPSSSPYTTEGNIFTSSSTQDMVREFQVRKFTHLYLNKVNIFPPQLLNNRDFFEYFQPVIETEYGILYERKPESLLY